MDGFNPEYGAPTIPLPESLHQMMEEKDLWPMNKEVWNYLDGNGFHLMSTLYKDLTDCYGKSSSIEEFSAKGQLVGAMNSKSIWEVWNENKFDFGDRFCSGLLFWYHNNSMPQVCARMWDYYLEPTASLYHTMHSLEPLHIQFDYLTNTVSVINDYYEEFNGYTAEARLYDIDRKLVSGWKVGVDLPEDGVANDIMTLTFPENISQVHFIWLALKDNDGKTVSENFYWRSKDKYLGKPSVTGPATSGFESLSEMKSPEPLCMISRKEKDGRVFFTVKMKNMSKKISFFNRLQVVDDSQKPVRPAFYSDNFFTLLPGESKVITIDTADKSAKTVELR